MTDRDYKAEALVQGWKPKEEWTDSDKPWVDAQVFVEKGERIAGIARSRADKERIQFESRIVSLERKNKEFGEYQRAITERERAKNAQLISELETLRATAITDGDGQAFNKYDQEIRSVREVPSPPPNNGENPLAAAWLINNDWYNTNIKLRTYADGLADVIERDGYTGNAYFTEITRRVRQDFPEEFENKLQTGSTDVEPGGDVEVKDKTAHTYENLAPIDKDACDGFVAEGLLTREQYLADYEWDK